jgi:hypothetical protein
MAKNIMTHLETNNILQGKQHCFRARHSCETQLLELVKLVVITSPKRLTRCHMLGFSTSFSGMVSGGRPLIG